MSSSAKTVHEEIARKKAAYEAEMAELVRKEKEAVDKEEEAACNMEAARLAAEKAAKKEVKKGKKHVVEESDADVGGRGLQTKEKGEDGCSGQWRREPFRDHQGLL